MASEIETLENNKKQQVVDVEMKEAVDEPATAKGSKKGEKSPVTPSERPTRERKTVERFMETMSSPLSPKPFSVEKGSGTQLKEIPNVAYKLSKRKPDETLHSLHTVLYNKRAKVVTLKKNIGLFSGFVWAEDEQEKQKTKLKEKLDKCTKEKLFDFCDVLNLQIHKSLKKEEVTVKLIEFLQSPHATTEVLLAEKEQKAKKQKAKAKKRKTASSKKQSGEKRKRSSKSQEEDNAEEDNAEEDAGLESEGAESQEEDATNTHSKPESEEEENKSDEGGEEEEDKSEDEEESEPESEPTPKKSSAKKSAKKDSGAKTGEKSKTVKKAEVKTPTKSNKKSSASASKNESSGKKSEVEKSSKKAETKASAKKESAKEQGKGKANKKAKTEPTKPEPTNEEMHAVVASILKEVDFNTATLSDIIKQLGVHFGQDLLHRKAEVKAIITDVINNMSGDEDEDEEEKEAEPKAEVEGGSDEVKAEAEAEGGSDKDEDGDNDS